MPALARVAPGMFATLAVLALLACVPASAQQGPLPGDLPAVATPEVPATGLGDQVLEGLSNTGRGIRDAADAFGSGVAQAVSAVADAVREAATWSAHAVAGLARGAGAMGASVAVAIAAVGEAVGKVAVTSISALGEGVAWAIVGGLTALISVAATAARAIGAAAAAVGGAVGSAVAVVWALYLELVMRLKPVAMTTPMFAAAAGGGAVASAGAAAYAGWDAWRRWARALLGLGAVGGFSRISESDLLTHPLRKRIFETIQQEPGIHASALARAVGAGWGTIVHHLQKLEKARLVTARTVNNQKCFFEQGGDVSRQDMAVASAVKDGTAARIASYVQHHPLSSQKDVAATLGISPALASFHVKKLEAQGVLERVRDGRAWLLATTDSFHRVQQVGRTPAPRAVAPVRAVA